MIIFFNCICKRHISETRTFNSELKVILESIAKLSQEYTGIQEKIRENNQRIDERSQSLVKAEQTLQLRKNEIAEIESYEYEHGIDISVMVIITQLHTASCGSVLV